MTTKTTPQLPSPPTFSQMMEDLEIMSSHEKKFHFENYESTSDQSVEQTNTFLARLETLQRLDASLETQNDSTNDQLEKKLKDIIEQLQMCLTKFQTNSFLNTKKLLSDNKK